VVQYTIKEEVQGGLWCCHHEVVLLDQDQVQPMEMLTYRLKFRFWFQAGLFALNCYTLNFYKIN
jgi:hypothetical protein